MDTNIYSYQQIHKVPKSPGIYGWFVRVRNHMNIEEYHSIYKSNSMDAKVEGNLKKEYTGVLSQEEYNFGESIENDVLFKKAVFTFCNPIYVGVSMKLRRRLEEHYKQLNRRINVGDKKKQLEDVEPDTDGESEHFAQRISDIVNRLSTVDTNSLFIKTVEVNEDVKFSKLLEVEKFINRTFTPSYGRK